MTLNTRQQSSRIGVTVTPTPGWEPLIADGETVFSSRRDRGSSLPPQVKTSSAGSRQRRRAGQPKATERPSGVMDDTGSDLSGWDGSRRNLQGTDNPLEIDKKALDIALMIVRGDFRPLDITQEMVGATLWHEGQIVIAQDGRQPLAAPPPGPPAELARDIPPEYVEMLDDLKNGLGREWRSATEIARLVDNGDKDGELARREVCRRKLKRLAAARIIDQEIRRIRNRDCPFFRNIHR